MRTLARELRRLDSLIRRFFAVELPRTAFLTEVVERHLRASAPALPPRRRACRVVQEAFQLLDFTGGQRIGGVGFYFLRQGVLLR